MKKIILSLLFLFIGCVTSVNAAGSVDYISQFRSDVELKQNTDIVIEEKIDYYFATPAHGIYREIPINYKVDIGFQRPTILTLDSLYYYPTLSPSSTKNVYERDYSNGYAIFKIGEADSTVFGDYTFVIKYTLKNAINYFDTHDEVYFNVTGNGWEVPMKSVITKITTPGDIIEEICYTGETGSKLKNCTMVVDPKNSITVSASSLNEYEGLTVALKMPKGTLLDTTSQQRIAFLIANAGLFLPIPVLILMLLVIKKINKNKKITVIPNYDAPKDMTALLAGYIYSKKLPNSTFTAQIIEMAIKGYLRIKQVSEKEYEIVKLPEKVPTNIAEKILYDGIFKDSDRVSFKNSSFSIFKSTTKTNDTYKTEVKVTPEISTESKPLSSTFYNTVASSLSAVDTEAYERGYFSKASKKFGRIVGIISAVGFVISFLSFGYLIDNAAASWAFGLVVSSFIILFMGRRIDLKSVSGNEIYYELLGLKMYINTAEKHRIEFHNDPKKYLDVFEKLLPYAIIFGLEKKWAKEFEDIYIEAPEWYQGNMNNFSTYMLINSISLMHTQVQTHSMAPRSTSSNGFFSSHGASGGSGFSGGFSGGGFGGGGGGRW